MTLQDFTELLVLEECCDSGATNLGISAFETCFPHELTLIFLGFTDHITHLIENRPNRLQIPEFNVLFPHRCILIEDRYFKILRLRPSMHITQITCLAPPPPPRPPPRFILASSLQSRFCFKLITNMLTSSWIGQSCQFSD